jgi:allantoinase
VSSPSFDFSPFHLLTFALMLDTIIRGARIAENTVDIGLSGGLIARLEPEILEPALRVIEASGSQAVAAVVDAHVHFNEPGRVDWEGIRTGSSALAAGGGAVFLDMPLNSSPVTTTPAAFDAKLECMKNSSVTDFALWGGLTPESLPHLEALAQRGVIGFKAFMSNSGMPEFGHSSADVLLEGMRAAAKLGLPVAVHAESEKLTSSLTRAARAAGRSGIRDYLDSRPIEAELEAINLALRIAEETGCALHIVHISNAAGVRLVQDAKTRGVDVTAETCPHYLWFDDTDLERVGAALKCAPPMRSRTEVETLWQSLEWVDIIGSDHSPAPPEMKTSSDFFAIWGGISGVQSTLEACLTGARQRGLTLEPLMKKWSTVPAQRFHLANKGRLEIGFDADIALVRLDQAWTIKTSDLLCRHKQSPYVGSTFTARVMQTLVRGQTVWDGSKVLEQKGRFLRPGP